MKPIPLSDLPRAFIERNRAELCREPHPKTTHPVGILAPLRPVTVKRARKPSAPAPKLNASGFFVSAGLPAVFAEYRFDETRRWRFDYAWIAQKVALEVEGGVWSGGRHTRGKGFLGDVEKYNRAVVLGWRIVRCTPQTQQTAETIEMLRGLLS